MAHVRKRIKDYVSGSLNGGVNYSGKTEWHDRPITQAQAEAGHVVIGAGSETVNADEGAMSRVQSRELTLTVEGHFKNTSGSSPIVTLEAIAEEIEQKVLLYDYSNWCQPPELLSTEFAINDEGDKPHGVVTLEFLFTYYTEEGVPETAIT